MTALERWAVFFRYTPDKEKRKLINEIIEIEEGIAMSAQVLLTISKDEREWARLTSEYKYAVDLQSKMVDSKREGIRQVARNAMEMGMDTDTIIKLTGLTREEVKNLSDVGII